MKKFSNFFLMIFWVNQTEIIIIWHSLTSQTWEGKAQHKTLPFQDSGSVAQLSDQVFTPTCFSCVYASLNRHQISIIIICRSVHPQTNSIDLNCIPNRRTPKMNKVSFIVSINILPNYILLCVPIYMIIWITVLMVVKSKSY